MGIVLGVPFQKLHEEYLTGILRYITPSKNSRWRKNIAMIWKLKKSRLTL